MLFIGGYFVANFCAKLPKNVLLKNAERGNDREHQAMYARDQADEGSEP